VSTDTRVDEREGTRDAQELFDAVVIGTGFGGAVTACRLAQAQKKICILERGRRYGQNDSRDSGT
jgi:choline dehydrogenase-like flavoprotein